MVGDIEIPFYTPGRHLYVTVGGNVNLNPVPIFKFIYYFATEFMTSYIL